MSDSDDEVLKVSASIGDKGFLRELKASGHAGTETAGENIVCAAATVLIRTAVRLLDSDSSVKVFCTAEKRGKIIFVLETVPDDKKEWVKGVTDCLVLGLKELADEFPDRIKFKIIK